jgi:hypothetical protein
MQMLKPSKCDKLVDVACGLTNLQELLKQL